MSDTPIFTFINTKFLFFINKDFLSLKKEFEANYPLLSSPDDNTWETICVLIIESINYFEREQEIENN